MTIINMHTYLEYEVQIMCYYAMVIKTYDMVSSQDGILADRNNQDDFKKHR